MTESRADIRAEYEAEFDPDGQDDALAKVDPAELMELLGPSRRDRENKLVLAFRTRVKAAEREVAEMREREVALQTQNRATVEHNAKLAAERDYWRDMKDPAQEIRAVREGAAKAAGGDAALRTALWRVEVLSLELERARRPFWQRWLGR